MLQVKFKYKAFSYCGLQYFMMILSLNLFLNIFCVQFDRYINPDI